MTNHLNIFWISVLLLILLLLLIVYFIYKNNKNNKEHYGWSCTFTPNKDYYLQDWLLGGNPVGLALARDSIKM